MSTLKANNIQHLNAGNPNIEIQPGGGTILTGVSTIGNANLVVESNASEGVRIDSNGRVGIGTDDPSKTLSILSSQSVMLQLESTSNTARIGFIVPNQNDSPTIGVSDLDDLQFRVGGSERVRIGSAGSFAIGSQAINESFAVGGAPGGGTGAFNVYTQNSGNWAAQIRMDSNNGNGLFLRGGGNNSNHFPLYVSNADEANSILVVTGNERVGVGTTNPQTALHVDSNGVQAIFNSTNANTYKIGFQNVGVTTSFIGAAQVGDIFTVSDSSATSKFALTHNGTIHDTDGCAAEAVPPGTQSTAAASAVNIQLSSATGNLGNGITFNNASDRFDITEAGVYMIHAIIEITSAASRAASTFSAGILKSGGSIAVNSYLHEGFTGGFTETFYCSTIEELANGENISMTYSQNTTTSATITSNSRLLVTRIA